MWFDNEENLKLMFHSESWKKLRHTNILSFEIHQHFLCLDTIRKTILMTFYFIILPVHILPSYKMMYQEWINLRNKGHCIIIHHWCTFSFLIYGYKTKIKAHEHEDSSSDEFCITKYQIFQVNIRYFIIILISNAYFFFKAYVVNKQWNTGLLNYTIMHIFYSVRGYIM